MLCEDKEVKERWVNYVSKWYEDELVDPSKIEDRNGCHILKAEVENEIRELNR